MPVPVVGAAPRAPSERIERALADVGSGTVGAMDLIRVARSKGDFLGKPQAEVPQLAHGPTRSSVLSEPRQGAW